MAACENLLNHYKDIYIQIQYPGEKSDKCHIVRPNTICSRKNLY